MLVYLPRSIRRRYAPWHIVTERIGSHINFMTSNVTLLLDDFFVTYRRFLSILPPRLIIASGAAPAADGLEGGGLGVLNSRMIDRTK